MAEERKGTSATRAKNKYNAKVYDHISFRVPKGEKEKIDKTINNLGYTSKNKFITDAIYEKIERETKK